MRINDSFRKLIPPLSVDEYKQLEANCIADGIRDPLVVWKGTLIDGHNRYEIAQKHGLEFVAIEKEFQDETAVKIWMVINQFGRRNIGNYDRSILALQLEDFYKAKARENLSIAGQNSPIKEPCQNSDKVEPIDTKKEIAKIANVSHDTIMRVKKIESTAKPEIIAAIRSGEKSINEAYKEIKAVEKKEELIEKKLDYEIRVEQKTENTQSIDIFKTKNKFRVIYADPAWSYNDKQDTPKLGGAVKHYDTMSTAEICGLPIKDITDKDSVLFLWVTSPLLPDGLEVIKAWGFNYKSSFVWDKVGHVMGHYNSVRHEFLLIAAKGSCTPDMKVLIDSVVSIEKTDKHSEKPKEFREIIDKLYTHGERIELFCRANDDKKWHIWGNEV
jgi:N6-adenosine-specific RNA methylase IME4/ParB-like chromosome segregation protein Spo0J